MSINNIDWTQLKTTFEQDLNISAQLLKRLVDEKKALETRDYTLFQQIISEKQTLLALLENHITRRQQWLQENGFSDETSALSAAKQHAPSVATAWQKLEQQWAHCKQLNEINERIAKRTHDVVGRLLDTLRGQNNQQRLYTNKGNTPSSGNGRTISNA